MRRSTWYFRKIWLSNLDRNIDLASSGQTRLQLLERKRRQQSRLKHLLINGRKWYAVTKNRGLASGQFGEELDNGMVVGIRLVNNSPLFSLSFSLQAGSFLWA